MWFGWSLGLHQTKEYHHGKYGGGHATEKAKDNTDSVDKEYAHLKNYD